MDVPPWGYRVARRRGVSTILLSGELDLASAETVQALLLEQLEADGVAEVLVDLADVGFLDSTTLGVLIKALNFAEELGRGFRVVNPSPPAQRILALTGLDVTLTQA